MEPCSRALQKCSPRPNRHPRLGPANDVTVPKAFVRFRTASYRVFALPPREASLLAPSAWSTAARDQPRHAGGRYRVGRGRGRAEPRRGWAGAWLNGNACACVSGTACHPCAFPTLFTFSSEDSTRLSRPESARPGSLTRPGSPGCSASVQLCAWCTRSRRMAPPA